MASAVAVMACAAGASYHYEQPKPGYIGGWVWGDVQGPHGSGAAAGGNYPTLEAAMLECDKWVVPVADADCKMSAEVKATPGSGCTCHGITYQGSGNWYQIRASPTLTPDATNQEKSWVRSDVRCSGGRGGELGTIFVLLAVLGTAIYAFGGRIYSRRILGRDEWPHAAMWADVHSLVLDGVSFTRSRVVKREARPTDDDDSSPELKGGERSEGRSSHKKRKKDRKSQGKDKVLNNKQKERDSKRGADTTCEEERPRSPLLAGTPSAGGGRWLHVPA